MFKLILTFYDTHHALGDTKKELGVLIFFKLGAEYSELTLSQGKYCLKSSSFVFKIGDRFSGLN
jgi:hypothetical protein